MPSRVRDTNKGGDMRYQVVRYYNNYVMTADIFDKLDEAIDFLETINDAWQADIETID